MHKSAFIESAFFGLPCVCEEVPRPSQILRDAPPKHRRRERQLGLCSLAGADVQTFQGNPRTPRHARDDWSCSSRMWRKHFRTGARSTKRSERSPRLHEVRRSPRPQVVEKGLAVRVEQRLATRSVRRIRDQNDTAASPFVLLIRTASRQEALSQTRDDARRQSTESRFATPDEL
jgi:hypothetical protein